MDPAEEQAQEIEILESIYPDELNIISDSQFTIKLLLDTNSSRKHRLLLHVKYPAQYPEIAPDLDVSVPEPDSDDDDDEDEDYEDDESEDEETKTPVNISEVTYFENEDLKKLLDILIEEAEMNVGMPSVFALASNLKDQAEELFASKVEDAQKVYDRELLAREMEEQKKFNGTKVTVESFNAWRSKFREELRIDEMDKQRVDMMHHGKMTGREIFEKGLGGDDDLEELGADISKLALE